MNKKIILPFEYQPYTIAYQGTAFSLGIIQGNAQEDITPWLSNKYINCSFDELATNKFLITVYDSWQVSDGILLKQRIDLFRDIFDDLYGNILTLLRKMIGMGFYPNGTFNEEYIPGKTYYQKKYFAHDYLLVGYDDKRKEFISAGYLNDGNFQCFSVPYDNMYKSITSLKRVRHTFNFWKFNENAEFKFCLERMASELCDYVNSTTSMKTYSKDKEWGLGSIRALMDYICKSSETDSIDYRYTRALLEHKYFMKMRMEYLYQNRYIKDPNCLALSQKIYDTSRTIHYYALKFNISPSIKTINSMNNLVNEILDIERDYLSNVLIELGGARGKI